MAREELYERVTARIVEQLEAGVLPWLKPWNAEHAAGRISRPLRCNGEPYRGINVLMLWESANAKGYAAPIWLTFQQAKELGGHVRAGEKSSPVVYAGSFKKEETNDAGETAQRDVPFLKQYAVFNAEQCADLPPEFTALAVEPKEAVHRIAHAEEFLRNTRARIVEGGNRAFYRTSDDSVTMPRIEAFRDAEAYTATLAHELTHWTKHPSRLNRDFGGKRFGDSAYAMEELVAELGAAFLCADLAITPEPSTDHAAYIAHWITGLKSDPRAIFTAASAAGKAVDFMHALQPTTAELCV